MNGKRRDEIDAWSATILRVVAGMLGVAMLIKTTFYGLPVGIESDVAILGWYALCAAFMGPLVAQTFRLTSRGGRDE